MLKRISNRLTAFVATMSVILSGMIVLPGHFLSQQALAADDTQDGILTLTTTAHDEDQSVPENWENWTGQNVAFTAGFNISGSDVNYYNAKFIVSIKKSGFINEPLIIDSAQAQSSTRRDTDDHYVVEYGYDQLGGGTAQKVKLNFQWKNWVTPNGTQTPIEVRLVDQDGNDILPPQRQIALAKAETGYTIDKQLASAYAQVYSFNPNLVVNERFNVLDVPTENHTNATRIEQLDPQRDALPVKYVLYVRSAEGQGDRPEGYGFYQAHTLTLTDVLPEEATLSQESVDEGWTYDAATHTAKRVFDTRGMERGYLDAYIKLDYHTGDIKVDDEVKAYTNRFTLRAEAPGIDPIEVPEVSTPVGFNAVPLPTFGGGNAIVRMNKVVDAVVKNEYYLLSSGNSGQLYNYDSNTLERMWPQATGIVMPHNDFWDENGNYNDPRKLEWTLWVSQENNGSSLDKPTKGGLTDTITEITDERLAPEFYYTSAYLTIPMMHGDDVLLPEVTEPGQTADERLRQSREAAIARVNAAQPIIYGVKADGTEVALTDAPLNLFDTRRPYVKQDGYRVWINDLDKKYTSLKLRFTNPLVMDNFSVHMVVEAYPLPSEMEKWENRAFADQGNRKGYDNWMNTHTFRTGHPDQVTTPEREVSVLDNTVTIQTADKRRGMGASISDRAKLDGVESWEREQTIPFINCEQKGLEGEDCPRVRAFRVGGSPVVGGGSKRTPLRDLRRVVLLPSGIEYKGMHERSRVNEGWNPEPTLIPNYKGTDKTALIFDYGTVEFARDLVFLADTTIAAASAPQKNEIQFFETWANKDEIRPDMTPYDTQDGLKNIPDALDIDDDGDTTEPIVNDSLFVSLIAPDENLTLKMVSTDEVRWHRHLPSHEVGTKLFYRVQVTNSTEISTNTMEILDVFPGKNDVKIAPNAQGVYLPRSWTLPVDGRNANQQHSAFVTPLTGPVLRAEAIHKGVLSDPSNRFDYLYSLTPQGQDTSAIINGEWKTADQISDWSKVTAFKAVLKKGATIRERETIRFVLPSVIPDTEENRALPNHYRAVNSVATRSQGNRFIEGNEATVGIVKYTVEGVVFEDTGLRYPDLPTRYPNGYVSDDEKRLGGYTVELLDATTDQVVTVDGAALTAVTDDNGHYSFTVYKSGKYKVRFTKLTAEEKFTPEDGKRTLSREWTDQVIDHVEHEDGLFGSTDPFPLNAEHNHQYRNAGLIDLPSPTIRVIKVDADDQSIRLNGASFNLTPSNGNLDLWKTGTTQNGGILNFDKLVAGEYCLRETYSPTGYARPTEDGPCITITDEAKVTEVVIPNRKMSGTIEFTKLDDAYEPLAGATFGLYKISDIGITEEHPFKTAVSGVDGIVRFTDLKAGSYQLKELSAPEGYEISDDQPVIDVTDADPAPMVYTHFLNKKKDRRWTVTVHHSIYLRDDEGNFVSFDVPEDMEFTTTVPGLENVPSVIVGKGTDQDSKLVIDDVIPETMYSVTVTRPKAPKGYVWVNEDPTQDPPVTQDAETGPVQSHHNLYFSWYLKKSDQPEEPDTPGDTPPDNPNTPGSPGDTPPGNPNTPGTPVTPPDNPNTPGTPGDTPPDNPNTPGNPVTPPPTVPEKPWWPFPWNPGVPNNPEKPKEPNPGVPGVPADPIPGEPRQPEPGKPGTPGTPADPEPGTSTQQPNPKAPMKRLPATGFNSALSGLAGLALAVGSVLIVGRRRRG